MKRLIVILGLTLYAYTISGQQNRIDFVVDGSELTGIFNPMML